jgi:GAF domain-containing protein
VLRTMADQVANAIENARLFDEQQRTASSLADRVRELDCLNDIGRKVDETPPLTEFLSWVAERIPPATRYPGSCAVAIEFEGRVYGTTEAMRLPCQVVQSLRVGREVRGRICLAFREEREILDGESALLGGIAQRVSGYIENRRLFEQTRAALTEVEATHRSYLRGRWQDFLGQQETLRRDGFTYEQPAPSAIVPTQANAGSWSPEVGSGQVEIEDPRDLKKRTEVAVPIVLRGQTIGILGLEDPNGMRQWSEEDRALAEAVGRQLALALENARLLEETQRGAARERMVGEITARMRETLDVDTVLQTAIREIGDALGLAKVEARMKDETAQPGNGHGERKS